MAEWFDQRRYDLSGNSTKKVFDRAAKSVDAARQFSRGASSDAPSENPGRFIEHARRAITGLFNDRPSAVVMQAAELDQTPMQRAIDESRFDAVLRDLKAAGPLGMTRELQEGAALAYNGIDAKARYDGRAPKLIEQAQAEGRAIPASLGTIEATKQDLRAAEDRLLTALQAQAPPGEVIECIDPDVAAAQRHWQAISTLGRQIILAQEQAVQQKAERPAWQGAQAIITCAI